MRYKNIIYTTGALLVIAASVAPGFPASAQTLEGSFQGPPVGANPPTGGGLFSVNAQRNIGFGGTGYTPTNTLGGALFDRVFMVAGANNPGVGVRNLTSGKKFILTADNDGRLTLFDDGGNAVRFYVDTNGDFVVGGLAALRATNVQANISARYITAGTFGRGLNDTPTGDFAFPGALGIGIASNLGLPANGLEVAGQANFSTIKITGGTPGAGRVLTSLDAAGLAAWQNLPPFPVTSVFGRIGAVVAGVGDYAVSQITGAAPLANPIFTGSVTMPGMGIWNNSGNVGIGTTDPLSKLNVGSGHRSLTFQPNLSGNGVYGAAIGVGTTIDTITSPNRITINANPDLYNAGVLITMGVASNDPFFNLYLIPRSGSGPRTIDEPPPQLRITPSTLLFTGNVVAGSGQFTGPVLVGPPTQSGEAATKGYVDTLVSGGGGAVVRATSCDGDATCEMASANLLNGDISGVRLLTAETIDVQKLNVTTIDPIYTIGDVSYATYVSDTIGLKMEVYGKAILREETRYKTQNTNMYSYAIDFKNASEGSDVWLFWQTIDEGRDMEDIIVNLTPEFDGRAWYELRPEEKQIIIYGAQGDSTPPWQGRISPALTVSYHLVAPRHDAKQWPTKLDNPKNKGTFLLPK